MQLLISRFHPLFYTSFLMMLLLLLPNYTKCNLSKIHLVYNHCSSFKKRLPVLQLKDTSNIFLSRYHIYVANPKKGFSYLLVFTDLLVRNQYTLPTSFSHISSFILFYKLKNHHLPLTTFILL